jgi:hypothetical protein
VEVPSGTALRHKQLGEEDQQASAGKITGSPWGAVVEAKVSQVMTMRIKRAPLN